MRAEYDSQADALSIDLLVGARWGDGEGVDDDYCTVTFAEGDARVANVELLSPTRELHLVAEAASRYGLDPEALRAAATAALAAPDRMVTLDLGVRAA